MIMKAWHEGLVKALWTLKREILGEDGTLICNYTPGSFACDPSKPVSECPCDGTNDERGGGNLEHMCTKRSRTRRMTMLCSHMCLTETTTRCCSSRP